MIVPNNPDLKNQIRATTIIFSALLITLLIFFIVAIVITKNNTISDKKDVDKIFVFLVPVFGFVVMFLSRTIYNQMLSKVGQNAGISQKIVNYRTAKIVSWAMIESGCILALIATMLTSDYLHTVVFIFLFGYLILMKPSKDSLIRDMRLNSEESDLLRKS